MSDPLFHVPPKLTERQQLAYDFIKSGASAKEVGQMLHEHRHCKWCVLAGPEGCSYAEQTGRDTLRALRKKGLVVRRQRTGIWQRVGAKPLASDLGSSRGDLPKEF